MEVERGDKLRLAHYGLCETELTSGGVTCVLRKAYTVFMLCDLRECRGEANESVGFGGRVVRLNCFGITTRGVGTRCITKVLTVASVFRLRFCRSRVESRVGVALEVPIAWRWCAVTILKLKPSGRTGGMIPLAFGGDLDSLRLTVLYCFTVAHHVGQLYTRGL